MESEYRELGGPYSNGNYSPDFYERNSKFVCKFKLWMSIFENIQPAFKNSLLFKSYCWNGDRSSLFNTFPTRLTFVNNKPLRYFFFPKFDIEIVNLVIWEKYFKAKFLNKTFDLHFSAPQSSHSWNLNIG